MIREEATYEAVGYYPRDLKPQSHKPIVSICTVCGIVKITTKNYYTPLCKSCVHKGNKNALGYKHTEDQKARHSATIMGENNHNWKSKVKCICLECGKEFEVSPCNSKNGRGKYCCQSCVAKARRHNQKPLMTVPEKIFKSICTKSNLPFKFVGDGALWLGNANPDFIHNSKKTVVEVFGDYWHSPLLRHVRYKETIEGRRAQLKAEGYKCIIIWESDLKRKDAEAFVKHLMQKEKII